MSEASILFDFNKAKQQAEEIDNIANSLSNLSKDKFESTMQALSKNWKGDSATKYLGKCTKLQGNLNTTVSDLHTVADNIRSIAKRIYDAEMEALRIAQEREAAARRAASKKNASK